MYHPSAPSVRRARITAVSWNGRAANMKPKAGTERFMREVVAIFAIAIFSIALLFILRPWKYFRAEPAPIVADSATPTPLQR